RKEVGLKPMTILEFRKELLMELIFPDGIDAIPKLRSEHRLVTTMLTMVGKKSSGTPSTRLKQSYCKVCYERIAKQEGSTAAKKKKKFVVTYCDGCDNKSMCEKCFE